jgi:hypothetical protein
MPGKDFESLFSNDGVGNRSTGSQVQGSADGHHLGFVIAVHAVSSSDALTAAEVSLS